MYFLSAIILMLTELYKVFQFVWYMYFYIIWIICIQLCFIFCYLYLFNSLYIRSILFDNLNCLSWDIMLKFHWVPFSSIVLKHKSTWHCMLDCVRTICMIPAKLFKFKHDVFSKIYIRSCFDKCTYSNHMIFAYIIFIW